MVKVSIVERGCRGCTLCVDTCPVGVFAQEASSSVATVVHPEDCLGCLSCVYVCPSRCIEVADVEVLRPFHRIEGHVALVERFLQEPSATRTLTAADWEEARRDVAARLHALASSVVETMGRGHKPVGRRAGAVAASHMPEMYEHVDLPGVLAGLKRELGAAFPLEFEVSGDAVRVGLAPCGLCAVVEGAGEKVGEAVLCEIFHEFLGGLLSTFARTPYRCELDAAGASCRMTLRPAR